MAKSYIINHIHSHTVDSETLCESYECVSGLYLYRKAATLVGAFIYNGNGNRNESDGKSHLFSKQKSSCLFFYFIYFFFEIIYMKLFAVSCFTCGCTQWKIILGLLFEMYNSTVSPGLSVRPVRIKNHYKIILSLYGILWLLCYTN